MVSRNIRHLPVVDGDEVVGIVSMRDMTRWAPEELSGGTRCPTSPDRTRRSRRPASSSASAARSSVVREGPGSSASGRS